jgi:aspartate/methionine/tyrosine aminotransferase
MSLFQPFELERMMSKWENTVQYNLSESGVHPVRLESLLEGDERLAELLATSLNYPQTNGTIPLRERIASLYPGATADNVLVTVGCAEANYIATRTLLAAGDEMAIMLPNYMQIWGIARNHGVVARPFNLDPARGWALDVEQLDDAVGQKTKLIAVCNPNNPTGAIMSDEEMEAVVAAADRVGAWILADEVYSGAERVREEESPSFWGRYDKVLAMNSLSKAYGLPGLRIGWMVAPAETADDVWARHEYTTISTTILSNKLAEIALSPAVRPTLIGRTRDYIRRGYPVLSGWLEEHEATFELVPPGAAAIAFIRYNIDVNSTHLTDRLRREKSVLIVPGDHFGLDNYLRISFGLPHDYLLPALDRIHELLVALQR